MRPLPLILTLLLGAAANIGGQPRASNLRERASIDCSEDPFNPKCNQVVANSPSTLWVENVPCTLDQIEHGEEPCRHQLERRLVLWGLLVKELLLEIAAGAIVTAAFTLANCKYTTGTMTHVLGDNT
jgi:hypothetical protein